MQTITKILEFAELRNRLEHQNTFKHVLILKQHK